MSAYLDYQRRRWVKPNASCGCGPTRRWLLPNQKLWQWSGRTEQKYSPDQPRVPAGNSDGGQWWRWRGGGGDGADQTTAKAMGLKALTRFGCI
jgi:hypothetical protein